MNENQIEQNSASKESYEKVGFEPQEKLHTSKTSEENIKTGPIEKWAYSMMPESYSLKRKRSILYLIAIAIFFIAFVIFTI
jgi:hypothetical protein